MKPKGFSRILDSVISTLCSVINILYYVPKTDKRPHSRKAKRCLQHSLIALSSVAKTDHLMLPPVQYVFREKRSGGYLHPISSPRGKRVRWLPPFYCVPRGKRDRWLPLFYWVPFGKGVRWLLPSYCAPVESESDGYLHPIESRVVFCILWLPLSSVINTLYSLTESDNRLHSRKTKRYL